MQSNHQVLDRFQIPEYKKLNPTKIKGHLYRGSNWSAFNRRNLSSIPNKHENIILNKVTLLNKGFSSKSPRFQNEKQDKNIGPGAYDLKDKHNKTFISSLGFGIGFTSKNERFPDLNDYNEKFRPGPGEYNNLIPKGHKLKGTSIKRQESISLIKTKPLYPGPGAYDSHIEHKGYKKHIDYSRSKSSKIASILINQHNPGPGDYFKGGETEIKKGDTNNTDTLEHKELSSQNQTVSCFYRSRSNFNREEKKRVLSQIGFEAGSQQSTFYEDAKANRNLFNQVKYNTNRTFYQVRRKRIDKGVGFYDLPSRFDIRSRERQGESAFFLSKSRRFPVPTIKIPGPAYYSPDKIVKKSFQLNKGEFIV